MYNTRGTGPGLCQVSFKRVEMSSPYIGIWPFFSSVKNSVKHLKFDFTASIADCWSLTAILKKWNETK